MSYPVTDSSSIPTLRAEGRPINARRHVSRGTGLWLTVAYGVLAMTTLATLGFVLLALLVGWFIETLFSRRIMARVRGSSLRVSSAQLPQLHQAAKTYSERLGLKEVPEIFVWESSELNALAVRIGARSSVLLMDDVVWGSIENGQPNALRFILAHELAHHALGHTGTLRSYLRRVVPPLSRMDELSADAVALQLLGEREAAYEGLFMLTVGPQMLKYINREELLRQATQVGEDKIWKKAERNSTHPLLLRRLHELRTVSMTEV
jgi:Zn-dependent protease with chaperone function